MIIFFPWLSEGLVTCLTLRLQRRVHSFTFRKDTNVTVVAHWQRFIVSSWNLSLNNNTVGEMWLKKHQVNTYLSPRFQVHRDRKRCCCTCAFPAGHRCTASHKERRRMSASSLANLGHMWGNTRSTATTPRLLGHLWGGNRKESPGILISRSRPRTSEGSSHISPSQQSKRKAFKVKRRPVVQWKWACRYSSHWPSERRWLPSLGWRSHGLNKCPLGLFYCHKDVETLKCSHKLSDLMVMVLFWFGSAEVLVHIWAEEKD